MRSSNPIRALFGIAAVAAVVATGQGCVADRPSRNGVFNENQYIRKDFLVQPGSGGGDPGWFMKATIVQTSTPNPFANLNLFTGAENGGTSIAGSWVRFVITSDKLDIVDMMELSNSGDINAQNTRTPAVENAWPVTNVDLKYRVNLDGEKTNFYEENQELDWQVRQWVKVNFDKNDMSDVAALGPYQAAMLGMCGDQTNSSATLVPDSFLVDETNNYMQFTIAITVPVDVGGTPNSAKCMQAYGSVGQDFLRMNRSAVTMNVMYSFMRAPATPSPTYVPLVVGEKDPIRHKYGLLENTVYNRDTNSGLLAANQYVIRFDPNQPITWYLAQGYPTEFAGMWTRAGGIQDQTNAILTKAGAQARLTVLNYNDQTTLGDAAGPARQYGDIRYNFIRWESDLDTDSPFAAVTQFQSDPRTGQLNSASINVAGAPLKDFVEQRIVAYLTKVIGGNPFSDPPPDPNNPGGTLPATCTSGQSIPVVPANVQSYVYANSTLYQKMQQYLGAPPDGASAAGPSDYVYNHTGPAGGTFYQAYYALIPYTTYADPAMNQFVTPANGELSQGVAQLISALDDETAFSAANDELEHGGGLAGLTLSGGQQGMIDAYNAVDNIRTLWAGHRNYMYLNNLPHSTMRGDTADLISFPGTIARSSRLCVNGAWETQAAWETRLIETWWESIVWHEFGHVLGLDHNFMGSVDKANWPTYTDSNGQTQYGIYTSSLMDYNINPDRVNWNNGTTGTATPETGWLPYDQGAIAYIYGNNLTAANAGPKAATPAAGQQVGASGQVSATAPWNDPYGWNGTTEKQFLYCGSQHIRYTPLCRQFDLGSTPSEITAADIEQYEWEYNWRNFRQYYKTWDDAPYANIVANTINDTRRFMAMQAWDWSPAELTDKLIQVGINAPSGAANSGLFYQQLVQEFQADVGAAELMIAAFHEAIIQQSTGQRPFQTTFDPYYGDVTQQGISADKEFAFVNWLGIWPYDNYDPTQSNGYWGSSMTIGPGQGQPSQAWSTAGSMLGEKGPWDAYPQFFPSAVSLFAHDTQSPIFTTLGFPQMRDWIGGHTFVREADALAYFQQIAVNNPTGLNGCASLATCTYNPMTPQTSAIDVGHSNPQTNAFIGPDGRRWVWVYLPDRNIWFFCDQDRNSSSYFQVLTYNQDLLVNFDDGNTPGAAYNDDAKVKYMIDAYGVWGGNTTAQ
jgi:hypothetical protein